MDRRMFNDHHELLLVLSLEARHDNYHIQDIRNIEGRKDEERSE
jgi:hypothetical protein